MSTFWLTEMVFRFKQEELGQEVCIISSPGSHEVPSVTVPDSPSE